MNDKRLIVFDLDGTLTKSKACLENDMRDAVIELLEKGFRVGVVSGCGYEQMFNQFLVPIKDAAECKSNMNTLMTKLYLLPTSGSRLYQWNTLERRFQHLYKYDLSLKEKARIYNAWESSVLDSDFDIADTHGEIAEDRGSQITFSMCGQKAPLKVKELYDPDSKRRIAIVSAMKKYLPNGYEIRIGGTTSIDVTKYGKDKAFGVSALIEKLDVDKNKVLFIGDSLFVGGNDAPVKKLNIKCKEVSGAHETLRIINSIIGA